MSDNSPLTFGQVIRFILMVLLLTVLFAGLPLILLNRMLVARPWMFWSIVVVAFGAAVWVTAVSLRDQGKP